MSLRRNAAWTAMDTFVSAGLSFTFRLLVAKVLTPDQFGVAAIALTLMAVLQVVNDFGLTAALIQKDEEQVTPQLINTTFTASLLVSLTLAALTAAVVSPLSSWFFGEPAIAPLIQVLAITLLPSPFITVGSALLFRQRRFREVAIIRVIATFLSLPIAGAVLFLWPSPWVVVVQALAMSAISLTGITLATRWRFRLVTRLKHFKDLFGFSSLVLLNDLAVSFSSNAGVFILGRIVSASDAGLYALANYMTDTVRRSLMSILNRVTFVHFSQIKHDKEKLAKAYLSVVTWNCRVIFPIMTTFMLFGPALMVHFYGDRWEDVGSVVRWLSLAVMINAAGGATSNLYKAMGRPGIDLALFLTTTLLVLLPGMVLGAYLSGLAGVAFAAAVAKLVAVIARQVLLDRLIGNTALAVIRTVVQLTLKQSPLVVAWMLGVLVWPSHGWIVDVLLAAVGCAVYAMIELPRAFPQVAARLVAALKRPGSPR